jgi:predicted ArsR family transcriptional regulator
MRRLEAVGDRGLRETLVFARAQELPVTADDVAAAQRIHRNVARSRLERLSAAGLLIPSFSRRTGRTGPGAGRPAKTYRVAPELAAVEFPQRRYERLIGLVAEAVPEGVRRRRLREAGRAFGEELAAESQLRSAKSLASALHRVCAAMRRLGYQASVAELTDVDGIIRTPTCPLRPLLRAQPDLAELDRGMWEALLARALRGATVDGISCDMRLCRLEDADCQIVLKLRAPRRRARGPHA